MLAAAVPPSLKSTFSGAALFARSAAARADAETPIAVNGSTRFSFGRSDGFIFRARRTGRRRDHFWRCSGGHFDAPAWRRIATDRSCGCGALALGGPACLATAARRHLLTRFDSAIDLKYRL